MEITKQILEDLDQLPELLNDASGELTKEKLSELITEVQESSSGFGWEAGLKHLVEPTEELIFEPTDLELFQEAQAKALNVTGEWATEAAKLALASYIVKGGSFLNKTEAVVDLKEVFPNLSEEVKTEICYKDLNSLPEEAFKGPNRTNPVVNFVTAFHASKEATESVREFGLEAQTEGEAVIFWGDASEFTLKYNSNLSAEEMVAAFPLSEEEVEQATKFIEYVKSVDFNKITLEESPKPVKLSYQTLAKMAAAKEKNDSVLPTLVGVVRKLGLTKEDLATASNAYSVLSKSVLEKLLEAIPEKFEAPSISNEEPPSISNEGDSSISVVIDPIADESSSGTESTKSSKKSSVSWKRTSNSKRS